MYTWLLVYCTRHITYMIQTIPSVFTWLHLKIILRSISLHLPGKKTEPRSCKNYHMSHDLFQFCFYLLIRARAIRVKNKILALVYENLFVSDHLYFLVKPVHNLYSLWRVYLQCLLTFPSHSALFWLSWFINHRDQVTPKETLWFFTMQGVPTMLWIVMTLQVALLNLSLLHDAYASNKIKILF